MDLDIIEGLNEIRPSVYRVSMKLLSLQKLCHMDVVTLRHIAVALQSGDGAKLQQDAGLNRQEVTRTLNRMFHSVSQEVPGHVTVETLEETCSLLFRLYDRRQAGFVSAGSFQTALIALSSEPLLLKYRGLLSVTETGSGSVSRSGLRSLLQDLSQVPAAVQEEGIFGGVETAVKSCFNGVLTPTASVEHVLSWLQSEPRLLLWLPTLYRLSISQNISHSVRCHTCKTFPFTGLRYRCMKCVNVHVCQSCFLTDKQTRKHKTHHPVLEFCTQPTWRESVSSLVQRARHALLPRRYTQREADRRRVFMWAESGEAQNRAPSPSDSSTRLAASAVTHHPSFDRDVSHDATARPPPRSFSSKALQTDEETPPPQSAATALLTAVRNLQRDKWLLEKQLQAWQLTAQSEQGILEDRCSEMEVTMETLREHNQCLQGMLTQALNKMEAQQHADITPQSVNTEQTEREHGVSEDEEEEDEEELLKTEDKEEEDEEELLKTEEDEEELLKTEDKEEEDEEELLKTEEDEEELLKTEDKEEEDEEELLKTEDKWCEEQTPSPTMYQDTPPSHDIHCEEESAGDSFLCHPIGQQDGAEGAGPQEEDAGLSKKEEDCGTCSPEELLQETVERLKTVMETDRWTERQTGDRKRVALLEAADQVGDSIHHLVDAVRANSDTQ